MTAAMLALHLALAQGPTVTYSDIPAEVLRVSVHAWREAAPPTAVPAGVERSGDRLIVRGTSGRRSLVVLERSDGAYLVDGPFWWPSSDAERALDRRWRRTIAVASPEPVAGPFGLEWVYGGPDQTGDWPRCFTTGERLWACWGAAVAASGVLVCPRQERVWWTVVSRGAAGNLRSSKWGRLLVVAAAGDTSGLRVRFGRPVALSAQRLRGLRLDTATVPGAESTEVAPGVAWLAGEDMPPKAWIEVRTAHSGPAYLPLEDVAGGPPSLPLTMRLDDTLGVEGLVLGGRDERASGALVTLFRMIDPPAASSLPSREKPRRVLVTETTADAGGAFHMDDVGDADYEIVAWHPQLGRASSALSRTAGVVTVRLQSPGMVRGRVLTAGQPRAGVDVISLPGPEAFRNADDLIELKGGDTRTGSDGRVAVMLAGSGGGELRVGGGTFAIRRFPLPRVPAPLVDLGDIDLGSPFAITIVLDQESSCDVRATGPIGRSGLQIIMGSRTGPGLFRMVLPEPGQWAFGLLCGREEHPLSPMTRPIGLADAGKEVRFSVR